MNDKERKGKYINKTFYITSLSQSMLLLDISLLLFCIIWSTQWQVRCRETPHFGNRQLKRCGTFSGGRKVTDVDQWWKTYSYCSIVFIWQLTFWLNMYRKLIII